MWCDEEQDFGRVLRHQFSLEHVPDDRDAGDSRRPLSLTRLLIGKNAAHDCRSAIRHQHFRLHALRVDTRNAADCDTRVHSVVLDRYAKHDRSGISNLRSD